MEDTTEIQKTIIDENTPKQKKRVMTPETLEKLKVAREKANAVRKNLAEQRKSEKELLVKQEVERQQAVKQLRLKKLAETEARKILAESAKPESPTNEPEEPVVKKKTKRQPIIIEHSDSSDSEDDIIDARIYRVKRSKENNSPPPPPPVVKSREQIEFDRSYQRLFGRPSQFL